MPNDRETETITSADVATVESVLGKPKNAIIVCSRCKAKVDKGAPAQPGQNDASFVCEDCNSEHNAKTIAAESPTVVIDGDK